MTSGRYRVIGLAQARSAWFRDLSRWSTNAALPVEFVKCVSADELEARLASGQAYSAMIVDGGLPSVDRDLVDLARQAGAAVVVVDDGRRRTDWAALGVDGVLADPVERGDLLAVLSTCAPVLRGPAREAAGLCGPPPPGWRGRLVAVTGPSGGGSSTVAMALAQGLGTAPRHQGLVALADLALHADQALLHDAGDIIPGLQELVEAHRLDRPSVDQVRSFAFDTGPRGYDLVLGLRRHRDWPVLRPRAVQAALDGLLRTYRLVVGDVDPDLEGDDQVGSVDVEERNVLARSVAARAELVLVVAQPTVVGLRRLVLVADEWHRAGMAAERLVPVITRGPRRALARAEVAQAVADLAGGMHPDLAAGLPTPLFVAERRGVDGLHRAAMALPAAMVRPVAAAVEAMVDRLPLRATEGGAVPALQVVPGSLGAWADEEANG